MADDPKNRFEQERQSIAEGLWHRSGEFWERAFFAALSSGKAPFESFDIADKALAMLMMRVGALPVQE